MAGPFEITGDLGVAPQHLRDIATALEEWEAARDAEREAMARLVATVDVAREDYGEPLQSIADVLCRTRQYVQKLLRRARTEEEERAYLEARYNPENARRSLGRTGGYDRPQCPGCRAFLKHAGAQCSNCGFMGDGGYLGVPAKTSHLERWR